MVVFIILIYNKKINNNNKNNKNKNKKFTIAIRYYNLKKVGYW